MVVMDDVSEEYVSLFKLLQDNPILSSKEHLGSCKLLLEEVGQCLQQFHHIRKKGFGPRETWRNPSCSRQFHISESIFGSLGCSRHLQVSL